MTEDTVEILAIVAKSNSIEWLSQFGDGPALSKVKDDLSRVLRMAEKEEIVITRHGTPAAVLVGFRDEDDWFDYRLENDPRFLSRIETARQSLGRGRGVKLEEVEDES